MRQKTKLKKAASTVAYEISMFRETGKALSISGHDQFHTNVFLESFVIHAYVLYRFFYQGEVEKINKKRRPRRPSDIIAEDFGIKRRQFRSNRIPKRHLKNIVVKRDKQLAHLTYNRIYRNKITEVWPHGSIVKKMEKTIKAFFNALPNENRYLFDPKKNEYLHK